MKLRYRRSAVSDLEKIFRHIATDNPDAARDLVVQISKVTSLIAAFPHMGQATSNPKFRRHPIGKYLIVYRIRKDELIIQYIRHGARLRPWERKKKK
jgi:addiction module RelE/StbE family toxin